jgi:hypothetical protein
MVPIAVGFATSGCTQSAAKRGGKNPVGTDSVTVKEPGPNVTITACPLVIVNEDG